jgi:hypothetical protein
MIHLRCISFSCWPFILWSAAVVPHSINVVGSALSSRQHAVEAMAEQCSEGDKIETQDSVRCEAKNYYTPSVCHCVASVFCACRRNRYHAPYETCLLVYLFKMARPWRLHADCEAKFGMRKSYLSVIVQSFGSALLQLSHKYLINPSI